jgi:hypothetical protein
VSALKESPSTAVPRVGSAGSLSRALRRAFLIGGLLPPGAGAHLSRTALPDILVATGVASTWLVPRLKERVSVPGTGQTEYREPGPLVLTLTVLSLLAGAGGRR